MRPCATLKRAVPHNPAPMNASSAARLDYDPTAIGAVRSLLAEAGAVPNRALGQNFLVNPGALDRIVATAQVQAGEAALEIGSGLGALTCRLVATGAQVVAIEKDEALFRLLSRRLPAPNLRLLH